MNNLLPILANIVIPLLAGGIFFGLAFYVRHISPMRQLITGKLTYQGAFWGLLFFGAYLSTRPLQILAGAHPWPLVINSIREFFMIALFGPAVFIAMMSLVFGAEKIRRSFIVGMFAGGILLALAFVAANIFAIGGSEPLFDIFGRVAYDGIWFHNPEEPWALYVLFWVRILNPTILIATAGGIVLWRSFTYPKDSIYDNMPKKLLYLSWACFALSFSMLFTGFMIVVLNIPNQWWIYYVGALISGILEAISLGLPVKKGVKLSEAIK